MCKKETSFIIGYKKRLVVTSRLVIDLWREKSKGQKYFYVVFDVYQMIGKERAVLYGW